MIKRSCRKVFIILCCVLVVSGGTSVDLPLLAAFYYPFYPEEWPLPNKLPYEPLLGFYNSYDTEVVDHHIISMDYANIDVAIIFWNGRGEYSEDSRIPLLFDRTQQLGSSLKWCIFHFPDISTTQDMNENLDYLAIYTSHPQYALINGKPLIFFAHTHSCSEATQWHLSSDDNWWLVLKIFSGWSDCVNQPDGWYQMGADNPEIVNHQYYYTISPGFWRVSEAEPRYERDIDLWAYVVTQLLSSNAPLKLITSFNDWIEGCSIEEAVEWNTTYLDVLHCNGELECPSSSSSDYSSSILSSSERQYSSSSSTRSSSTSNSFSSFFPLSSIACPTSQVNECNLLFDNCEENSNDVCLCRRLYIYCLKDNGCTDTYFYEFESHVCDFLECTDCPTEDSDDTWLSASCATGCFYYYLRDTICQEDCAVEECSYDLNHCESSDLVRILSISLGATALCFCFFAAVVVIFLVYKRLQKPKLKHKQNPNTPIEAEMFGKFEPIYSVGASSGSDSATPTCYSGSDGSISPTFGNISFDNASEISLPSDISPPCLYIENTEYYR